MNGQPYRLPHGGLIDRAQPLDFRFNGRQLQGYAGDTLASALLANGVHWVARSFKYHRPRGIVATGAAEPNALVQLESGAYTEPNLQATQVMLYRDLSAASQNCWPSLTFDVAGLNDRINRLLPAGFYYKTFMWPARMWPRYERWIRRAAGMGRAPREPDPDRYEQRAWHGDVLVVGGGPAGLAAALAAGKSGARVLLVHEGHELGGGLLAQASSVDGQPPARWVHDRTMELTALDNVTVVTGASAAGYYDGNFVTVCEKRFEGLTAGGSGSPRQRLWKVQIGCVVLATGAIERPLVFADNDRPGVMLASAVRRYVNQFAVAPGRKIVIAANNDSAFEAALDLHGAGVGVAAVVDTRRAADSPAQQRARQAGIRCLYQHRPLRARGRRALAALEVTDARGEITTLACDAVGTSGGWNPTVHLFSQSQGRIVFDECLNAFVPGEPAQATLCAGAINGVSALPAAVEEGWRMGASAAQRCGYDQPAQTLQVETGQDSAAPMQPLWAVEPPGRGHGKRFVDLQNDVTADDVALAVIENYQSVEHLKRYTTLGMGTDQGKTSNVNGLAVLAGLLHKPIAEVGTTTFRPHYTPVTLGAWAGQRRGRGFAPWRRTPLDACHEAAGAQFVNVGLWRRPQYYPQPGESPWKAVQREARSVRQSAGVVDVSTLGKIDVHGPHAAEFLDRVYAKRVGHLKPGRSTYAVMLRDDGCVFDDGTVSRMGPEYFHLTTTTAHAGAVMQHLAYHHQRYHPLMRVFLSPVTDNWATLAVAGPRSREVLERLNPDCAIDAESFPFMRVREAHLDGDMPARVFRNSYSGELAFEIAVSPDAGPRLWQRLLEVGAPLGLGPYGTEAMSVLRIEKGHTVIGAEIDGRTTADDLGMAKLLHKDGDFVGRRALTLPALNAGDRKQLVGLDGGGGESEIPVGAQLVGDPARPAPNPILGHVTSACFSPELGRPIALGLLSRGRERTGEQLHAVAPMTGEQVLLTVTSPAFIDPKGLRLRA